MVLAAWVPSEASFLGLQVPSSPFILTWSLPLLTCVLISPSYKAEPTRTTSFYLNYLLKSPLLNYSHISEVLGVRMSTCEFEEDTVPPITTSHGAGSSGSQLTLSPAFIYLPSRAVVLEPGPVLESSGVFKQEELQPSPTPDQFSQNLWGKTWVQACF